MLTHDGMVNKFLWWHHRANSTQRQQGTEWYTDARKLCSSLAREYNIELSVVAGVVATLSPAQRWEGNKTIARKLINDWSTGNVGSNGGYHTKQQTTKALGMLNNSSVEGFLKGPKVTAFYNAIMGNPSPTIDTWMIRGIEGLDFNKTISDQNYKRYAAALTEAAKHLCRPLHEVQATIWIVIRGNHK